ncbi:MAG: PQQ-binding-like beta-propeller repeat protein [Bacillota bacterium]
MRRWGIEAQLQVRSNPGVCQDTLFMSLRSGEVLAVQLQTGQVVWRVNSHGIVRGGFAVLGGSIVFGTDQGKVTCLDSFTGAVNWETDLGDPVVCDPAFDSKNIYVIGQSGTAYALLAVTGATMWKASLGDLPGGPPVATGDTVYVVTAGGGTGRARVYAITAATGQVRLLAQLEGWSGGYIQVQGDTLFAITSSDEAGSVWALDTDSGQPLWRFRDSFSSRWGSMLVCHDTLYAGSQGRVVALDAATGDLKWQWTGEALVTKVGKRKATFYPNVIGISLGQEPELVVTLYWEAASCGKVLALDAVSGHLVWEKGFTSQFASGALACGRTVIVPLVDQAVTLGRPGITVQGRQVVDPEAPIYLWGQVMYAPLRTLAQAMGFVVDWDPGSWQVKCSSGEVQAWVPVGECYIMVGGKRAETPGPVTIANSRVMVPVRAFVEAVGWSISWDQASLTAHVIPATYPQGR